MISKASRIESTRSVRHADREGSLKALIVGRSKLASRELWRCPKTKNRWQSCKDDICLGISNR